MKKLEGKVAVVTGASKGIGRAIAKRLAADGALVAVHYGASASEAEETVKAIAASGGKAFAVQANLDSMAGVDKLYRELDAALTKQTGSNRFDILVNNAGIVDWSPWDQISESAFDRLFAVNVKSMYFGMVHASKRLKDNGRVINISSIVSDHAFPAITAYNATKGAVDTITINFAQMLGERGITVNAVSPGATDTDMSAWMRTPEGAEQAKSKQALKRLGQPEDIAGMVSAMASNDSAWVTGQVIHASGGWAL